MPDVHLLTLPGPDLRQVTVVCRATMPELGSWNLHAVTCPRCLEPSRQRTQGPGDDSRERALQELVRQACGVQGFLYYHTHRSQPSPAGFPDTIAIRGERLIVAELKRAGQEPSQEQARWLEAFRQVQVIETYVWHPEDLPTILEVLR